MLALLAARLGLGKAAIVALVCAVLLTVSGLAIWRGAAVLSGMVSSAAASARAERDAHWRAEIATSNAAVEHARTEQLQATVAAEAKAATAVARLRDELTQMEIANAALPNPDRCGLDHDRVRLLAPRK